MENDNELIEVKIGALIMDPNTNTPIVVLKGIESETVLPQFGDYPLEVFGGDQQLARSEQELATRFGVQPNAFILGDELVKCFQVKLGAVRRF